MSVRHNPHIKCGRNKKIIDCNPNFGIFWAALFEDKDCPPPLFSLSLSPLPLFLFYLSENDDLICDLSYDMWIIVLRLMYYFMGDFVLMHINWCLLGSHRLNMIVPISNRKVNPVLNYVYTRHTIQILDSLKDLSPKRWRCMHGVYWHYKIKTKDSSNPSIQNSSMKIYT